MQKKYEPSRFRSAEYQAVWSDIPATQVCRFSDVAVEGMKDMAAEGYPDEICGLLVGMIDSDRWDVREVRQVKNINVERASDRFQLDPAGYQRVDKAFRGSGMEIIGVFHSHPDCPAKPSPTDLESAWEGFVYPIISVCDGHVAEIQCWEPNDATRQFHSVQAAGLNV